MSETLFYDLPKIEQIAVNLFYGWGYNFYRAENQLRADDLMVRSRVNLILGMARSTLETVQSDYRKKFLPLPSREHPRPEAECVTNAQTLEELSGLVGKLAGRITTMPVPENDRMTQRYRQELQTLVTLREYDTQLVGRAEMLREMLQAQDHEWVLLHEKDIRAGITAMLQTVQDRQRILA